MGVEGAQTETRSDSQTVTGIYQSKSRRAKLFCLPDHKVDLIGTYFG